jgi:N-acetylneuraminic acid mutarotase
MSQLARMSLIGASLLIVSSAALASPPPQSQQWELLPSMPIKRTDHAASYFTETGLLVIAGGRVPAGQGDPHTVAALDLDTQSWTPLGWSPATGDVKATRRADGHWMLFDEGSCSSYDPSSDTWTPEPALGETFRAAASLSPLPNGDVLIAGGFSDFNTYYDSLRYDPSGQAIVDEAPLNHGRAAHTATSLANGLVLVAGGWGWSLIGEFEVQEPATAAEVYDPATGTWTPVAAMNTSRERHTAVLLPSGQVLVAGGLTLHFEGEFPGTIATASVELYDPSQDTWSSVPPMLEARYGHTMTLLPSGRVIVAGGMSDSYAVLASAEAYDPATDTWTSLPPMAVPRLNATATLVPDHGLVVAGGRTASSIKTAVAEVELYPLGQLVNGSECFIGDDCQSGACTMGGVCAGKAGGGGG